MQHIEKLRIDGVRIAGAMVAQHMLKLRERLRDVRASLEVTRVQGFTRMGIDQRQVPDRWQFVGPGATPCPGHPERRHGQQRTQKSATGRVHEEIPRTCCGECPNSARKASVK
jgi:hypothetical protein